MALDEYFTLSADDAVTLRRGRVRELETRHYQLQLVAEEAGSNDAVASEQAELEAAIRYHCGVLGVPSPGPRRRPRRKSITASDDAAPVGGVSDGGSAPLDVEEAPTADTADDTT